MVTRTRRRSASRPAGPPAALVEQPGAPGHVGEPVEHGSVEPGTASTEPGLAEQQSAAPVVEHVPMKKKGSRKR